MYVDPAGMSGLEDMVNRAGEDADSARSHYDKHAGINWAGEGIINHCHDSDENIQRNVRDFLRKLSHEQLPATADAIAYARDFYARTDKASAERLDSTLAAADVASASRDVAVMAPGPSDQSLVRFGDACEPHTRLTTPPDFNEQMPFTPKWHDLASVGAMVRDAFWGVTWAASKLNICDRPYDLLEIALKPICGDWAGMARVAHVLRQVSDCMLDVSSNLVWAAQCTKWAWNGNAADAATVHLYVLEKALGQAAITMLAIGKEYDGAAKGAYDFSDTIGSLIVDATDAAVTAAAAAGVAGVVGSTGAGLPIALIIGVFCLSEVRKVVNCCITIVQIISKLDALTSTLKSAGNDFGSIDGDFPLPALPPLPELPR
ncbi:MAG TPA: hypothetical protein VF062_01515 [Candidatus Limnocylindrales bacterium]